MKRIPICAFALLLLTGFVAAQPLSAKNFNDDEVLFVSGVFMSSPTDISNKALERLVERGRTDIVPTLVLALRYRRDEPRIRDAFAQLTGQTIRDWSDAMLWQEAHPEVVPHISYRAIKQSVFEQIDPNFLRFLGDDRADPKNLDIRLEEITWGGVRVDGIPSLDDPKMIPAAEAGYLIDSDLVFGVEINGDVRAYPLRIMGWHEMFNETIGGVPVALAYCTLCGAGILFETGIPGRDTALVFGSSGLLYRSNKLMFDRETHSLWNQFTGEPVSGPLRGSGIRLKMRPVVITSWVKWKSRYPGTKVLALETGHARNYASGAVYRDYFASPELMFPAIVRNENVLKRKDLVFGIRDVAAARAWPVEAFRQRRVINDAIGGRNVVLIGDAETRTVRAYDRGDLVFETSDMPDRLIAAGDTWNIAEPALTGPDGTRLARLPGHISYWFAWDGYLGVKSTLYDPAAR